MRMIQEKGTAISVDVDEDGFLVRLEDWTETIAHILAEREGIAGMSREKLDILRSMRAYYLKHRFFPIMRSVCKSVHQPPHCLSEQFADPVMAWKIAGLPNPGEEVITFRSWEPLGY